MRKQWEEVDYCYEIAMRATPQEMAEVKRNAEQDYAVYAVLNSALNRSGQSELGQGLDILEYVLLMRKEW